MPTGTSAGLVMVTALQAAIPPAIKPRTADGFLTVTTGVTVGRAATAKGVGGLCKEGFDIVGDERELI